MSLVAYNASDDSDSDESDGGTESVNVTANEKKVSNSSLGHISDEEEYETVSSSSVSTGLSTLTRTSASYTTGVVASDLDLVDSSVTSLADLPAPRNAGEVIQEEEELEDEVKPKQSEIENALKPPDKKKHPVKITIPSLDKTENDEDDNVKKKSVPSMTKSGLFSLLPPPIHSAKKEINRPLIPHTLTRKPQTTAQAPSQAKSHKPIEKPSVPIPSNDSSKSVTKQKLALNVAMYGSDSDEEDTASASNFFSLDSLSKPKSSETESSRNSQSEEISNNSKASTKLPPGGNVPSGANNGSTKVSSDQEVDNENGDESEAAVSFGSEPGSVNDAPLDFGSVSSSRLSSSFPSSSYSHGYLGAVGLAGPVASLQNYTHEEPVASASAQYNMVEVVDDGSFDTVGDDDLKQFMSDKEFQRFSGKRKRGLEEAVNFVDANVDDYVDPSEISKHLTEETEYVSHKNKDNMPTAQQRRKKQITYLAYQAKEREFELKNTWAQNRMTKKQTQSKYGF